MKNKRNRITAILLMSIMLLGGVITAHAATALNCYDHTGSPRNERTSVASTSSHVVNGKVCNITNYQVTYDVYCSKCGAYLGTHTAPGAQVHSIKH